MPVGIMIEVPSAAIMAESFLPMVDYLSIGSNDLTQYTLAVDRGNDLIAGLYQDLHPAVLRLVQMTADAAQRGGKPVSICGELGSNPLATPVLIGMGISELSVVPSDVRALATRIRLLRHDECVALVDHILASSTSAEEVKRQILHFLVERELMDRFSKTGLRHRFGARLIKR
jgi:phosphotransferase system enzyme I (PtsI)